jgi:hypothetical protein
VSASFSFTSLERQTHQLDTPTNISHFMLPPHRYAAAVVASLICIKPSNVLCIAAVPASHLSSTRPPTTQEREMGRQHRPTWCCSVFSPAVALALPAAAACQSVAAAHCLLQGVGKSCLVLRYVRGTFDPSSKITVSEHSTRQQQATALHPKYQCLSRNSSWCMLA